jgi:hypothetical protein
MMPDMPDATYRYLALRVLYTHGAQTDRKGNSTYETSEKHEEMRAFVVSSVVMDNGCLDGWIDNNNINIKMHGNSIIVATVVAIVLSAHSSLLFLQPTDALQFSPLVSSSRISIRRPSYSAGIISELYSDIAGSDAEVERNG